MGIVSKNYKVSDFNGLLDILKQYLTETNSNLDWELGVVEENPDIDAYIDMARLFVTSTDGRVDCMLRFYNEYLIVSRIFLHSNTRQGWGTKIFDWLESFACSEGFVGVRIESVLTEDMSNFALKRKYKEEMSTSTFSVVDNYILLFSDTNVRKDN